jgi:transposase InsO family protein
VFEANGTRIINTPIRAPNANAYAERWVGTVRSECLDWTLARGRRHLERVLRIYVAHYNGHRPHRAIGPRAPAGRGGAAPPSNDPHRGVERRSLFGGLINEYERTA